MFRRTLLTVAVLLLTFGLLAIAIPQLRHIHRYALLMTRHLPDSLPVPVAGVRPARLADTWGGLRSGGRRHEGIDIFAPRNTPILSATEGVVSRRGVNQLGGRYVAVTGPGGHTHYYAHMERFAAVDAGEWVRRGDTIGYVGDSGNAKGTPTHLHYGIYRLGGGAINPYPFLAGRRR